MLIALALFAAQLAPSGLPAAVSSADARERAARCGLGPVTVRTDEELREEVLVVGTADAATDAQLACLDEAAGPFTVALPPRLQARFDERRNRRWAAVATADARRRLAAMGLLGRVPAYHPGVDDREFARAAERLCGPAASGALSSGFGPHAISPDWVLRLRPESKASSRAMECLMNVSLVAGYTLEFVGNEALRP